MKKNLLFLLIGLLPLLLTTACGEDGDDLKSSKKVEIVNGNVILSETETENGVTITLVSLFVYNNGVFDHIEQKIRYPDTKSAEAAYQAMQEYIDTEGAGYVRNLSVNGKTVTVIYANDYKDYEDEFGDISAMSAQELKNFLQSLIDKMK